MEEGEGAREEAMEEGPGGSREETVVLFGGRGREEAAVGADKAGVDEGIKEILVFEGGGSGGGGDEGEKKAVGNGTIAKDDSKVFADAGLTTKSGKSASVNAPLSSSSSSPRMSSTTPPSAVPIAGKGPWGKKSFVEVVRTMGGVGEGGEKGGGEK